jgi:hypothetical protein
MPALTDIDGAVRLDVQGICHAIGVILDGRVSEQGTLVGNRGRGARYNSMAAPSCCPLSNWPSSPWQRCVRCIGRCRRRGLLE